MLHRWPTASARGELRALPEVDQTGTFFLHPADSPDDGGLDLAFDGIGIVGRHPPEPLLLRVAAEGSPPLASGRPSPLGSPIWDLRWRRHHRPARSEVSLVGAVIRAAADLRLLPLSPGRVGPEP